MNERRPTPWTATPTGGQVPRDERLSGWTCGELGPQSEDTFNSWGKRNSSGVFFWDSFLGSRTMFFPWCFHDSFWVSGFWFRTGDPPKLRVPVTPVVPSIPVLWAPFLATICLAAAMDVCYVSRGSRENCHLPSYARQIGSRALCFFKMYVYMFMYYIHIHKYRRGGHGAWVLVFHKCS